MDTNEIAKKLKEQNALLPCSRCGGTSFTIINSYTKLNLDSHLDGSVRIGGDIIPTCMVVCDNCGAITMHALGALGLMNKKDTQNAK